MAKKKPETTPALTPEPPLDVDAAARLAIVAKLPAIVLAVELADVANCLRDALNQFVRQHTASELADALEQAGHSPWAEDEQGKPLPYNAAAFVEWFRHLADAQSFAAHLAEELNKHPVDTGGHLRRSVTRILPFATGAAKTA